ncbi:MAG TPA: molybdopterin-guanine dinucleotide biosynthesis protein A [Clostridiaceae bacterium]|jgi:molybdenum cofactor cytidylyltransferase|nr:molybdopterin-guanine dinucleotide biosynthesis protein A [Clostridiaceae bacterium]HBG37674.1 molybdopterin-guanine dinucleotide biosynthesis protein A [Clostridiaceae bacterium]HBN28772.1 molybdopterin-guanine dinucleotide biosynthesis protein A [Clostridiaceae bacterium]
MGVDGIVLAAGLSSRFGRYKLTLDIQGKTVIERCIEPMYDICSSIIVVGGHNYDSLCHTLKPYGKVKLIFNENYAEGMFSSIKKGILQVQQDKFILTPGDYPIIKKETYLKVLSTDNDIVVPVYKNINGHPVLIKSCLIGKILSGGYSSMREFIYEHGFSTICTEDEGILLDIDIPEDYEGLMKRLSSVNDHMI